MEKVIDHELSQDEHPSQPEMPEIALEEEQNARFHNGQAHQLW